MNEAISEGISALGESKKQNFKIISINDNITQLKKISSANKT